MTYGKKKRRLVEELTRAIQAGEVNSTCHYARAIGCHNSYVQMVARESASLRGAIRRHSAAERRPVPIRVDQSFSKNRSKTPSPQIRVEASLVRGAGFECGEMLVARAEAGRIVIFRA